MDDKDELYNQYLETLMDSKSDSDRKSYKECKTECSELDIENHRLKHWVIKWSVIFGSFITSCLVGSFIYGYLFKDKDYEGSVAGTAIETIFSVLKFVFE